MKKRKELICISCPIGCRLEVEYDELTEKNSGNEDQIKVSGNRCPRGITYGREEILAPKRVVTATAPIDSKIQSRLPVKTTGPILKAYIKPLLREIYGLKLSPPVEIGEILIENYRNTGINIVATMEIPR